MKNENEGIYYWKNPIEVPNVAALIVTATGGNRNPTSRLHFQKITVERQSILV
jgi:hypothetical protein